MKTIVGSFDSFEAAKRVSQDLMNEGFRDSDVNVVASNLRGESKGVRNPRKGSRPVFFAEAGRFVDTPVYDHYALAPGVTVQGPAIVEQRESTVVVGPNATASLDENYNLIMLLG